MTRDELEKLIAEVQDRQSELNNVEVNENGPTISELADRVKALKAASTIQTAPQRVQRGHPRTATETRALRIAWPAKSSAEGPGTWLPEWQFPNKGVKNPVLYGRG